MNETNPPSASSVSCTWERDEGKGGGKSENESSRIENFKGEEDRQELLQVEEEGGKRDSLDFDARDRGRGMKG